MTEPAADSPRLGWRWDDVGSGSGHMQRVLTSPGPDPRTAHREHLDHIDACGRCRESVDGSMCHTGHELWLKSRAARS